MATRRIREFLAGNRIAYTSINHQCAYTAQEIAQRSHVPGRCMAKSVVVVIDGKLAIVAVPATKLVDLDKLRDEVFAGTVRLANEDDFCNQFDGCQVGTVPPFGSIFGMETFVDRSLTREDSIAFNAGTHTDVFTIRYPDFVRLVQPRVVDVAIELRNDRAPRKRVARRRDDDGDERRSEPEESQLLQSECGCPIVHHSGSD